MKVKYLGHYNSAPFCTCSTMKLFDMALPHSQDEGHVFSGIKSMIYSFLVPYYKWLLRVKLRGETGLMNGFCLPLYYFLLFLQRSQLKKKRVKSWEPIAQNNPQTTFSLAQLPRFISHTCWQNFDCLQTSNECVASLYSMELVLLLRRPCELLYGPWSQFIWV